MLKWLNDSNFHRIKETESGWSKSSPHWELEHVLHAKVEGLDDELRCLGVKRRQELTNVYPGIFNSCIGVGDVKEFQVVKANDSGAGEKLIGTSFC